jgi:hypothetical protein
LINLDKAFVSTVGTGFALDGHKPQKENPMERSIGDDRAR